jgi:HEAT repeat protein
MCLKVVARHNVADSAERAAGLMHHPLPRVRIQALRAIAVVGDTEHFEGVLVAQADERMDVRRQALLTAEAMRFRLDVA